MKRRVDEFKTGASGRLGPKDLSVSRTFNVMFPPRFPVYVNINASLTVIMDGGETSPRKNRCYSPDRRSGWVSICGAKETDKFLNCLFFHYVGTRLTTINL